MTDRSFDSLIFDMDGTLWDAVDSYAEIWNRANREFGIDVTVTRSQLLRYMGKTIDVIFSALMSGIDVDKQLYLRRLDHLESTLMPELGGRFYPGVIDGLHRLAGRYPLFLVSNCGSDGLTNMMRYGALTPCFRGSLTYGETGHGKDFNIKQIIDRFSLHRPLYIGDTQGDSSSAHAAGAAMAHARWGFGQCSDAELSFGSFTELTDYLMNN